MSAIDSTGEGKDITTVMRRDLKMQLDTEDDWTAFKAVILLSLVLQIFGYMSGDLPFVNTLHSCTRYSGFGGRLDLAGKCVRITGEFDQYGGVPAMQSMTPEIPWKWTKVKVSLDYIACGTFYADPVNREVEWNPIETIEFPITEIPMPRMILLTGEMAKLAARGGNTPWELQMEGGKTTFSTPALLNAAVLELFDKWYIAQCQQTGGNALSNVNLCTVQSIDNQCPKWEHDRLNGTLGLTISQ